MRNSRTKNLNPSVQKQISNAESLLKSAQADKDKNRPSTLTKVLGLLDKATAALFSSTPPDGSGGGPGSGGIAGTGGTAIGSGGTGTAGTGTAGTDSGAGGTAGK